MKLLLVALMLIAAIAASDTVYLNIIHTNDIHGGIVPTEASFINPEFPPMMGGGAHIASYVNEVRDECELAGEQVLLIDVGDIYQGTPVGNYDTGRFVVEWMNALEYDMLALGNHDFDDGVDNMISIARQADFPVLCCNFVEVETGRIPEPVIATTLRELDGVRIAFIGVCTPDTYGLVDPSKLEGYIFRDELETVSRCIEEVRAEGADMVILLSHLGQPPDPEKYVGRVFDAWEAGEEYQKEWALNNAELSVILDGIDVIISGHTHIGYPQPWVDPIHHTVVVQGYANGTGIGHLRLAIDTETRSLVGYDLPYGVEYISLFHDEFWPDPEIAEMIDGFREIAEEGMDEVIGIAEAEIPRGPAEHPLGRLVADAMLWKTGADVALMNRGGIRAAIPRGPVTPRIVYQALPFEEYLYLIELTGEELLEILETGMQGRRRDMEIGGVAAVRDQTMPEGSKITRIAVGGEPLVEDSVYQFVTTGYLAQGNVGYEIMLDFDARFTEISLLRAVIEYISHHSPIRPDNDMRIIWINE